MTLYVKLIEETLEMRVAEIQKKDESIVPQFETRLNQALKGLDNIGCTVTDVKVTYKPNADPKSVFSYRHATIIYDDNTTEGD